MMNRAMKTKRTASLEQTFGMIVPAPTVFAANHRLACEIHPLCAGDRVVPPLRQFWAAMAHRRLRTRPPDWPA